MVYPNWFGVYLFWDIFYLFIFVGVKSFIFGLFGSFVCCLCKSVFVFLFLWVLCCLDGMFVLFWLTFFGRIDPRLQVVEVRTLFA